MISSDRPILFFLFANGDDFKIVEMTDAEANKQWSEGQRWLDVPQATRGECEELRLQYLSQSRSRPA
jgi:hypothetical protein